jgi:hypothetical protein
MQFTLTTLITLGLISLATAAPNGAPLKARDEFVSCSTMGDNCATDANRFCDSDTGRFSVCHSFGPDCWIQHTAEACVSKRSTEEQADEFLKRDRFDKCSSFGDICKDDDNEFCDALSGKISVCHHVPFSRECWIRKTSKSCQQGAHNHDDHEHAKRDRFQKCSTFGEGCNEDGNEFCHEGRKSTCHHVPFTNGEFNILGKILFVRHTNFELECWVRFGNEGC